MIIPSEVASDTRAHPRSESGRDECEGDQAPCHGEESPPPIDIAACRLRVERFLHHDLDKLVGAAAKLNCMVSKRLFRIFDGGTRLTRLRFWGY